MQSGSPHYSGYDQASEHGRIRLYQWDCMELLKQTPDKFYDLCIVDPPYGIGASKGIGKRKGERVFTEYVDKKWDTAPPQADYWNELERVSENRIIWGANYFGHTFNRMIVWDKQIGDNDFSMAEIASHTFQTPTKVVSMFCGANRNGSNTTRIHPTQKPVALYRWLLQNYAKPGWKILDTHLGSMSSVIACIEEGYSITGCELDKDYYDAGMKRVQNHLSQQKMFRPEELSTEGLMLKLDL